MSLSLCGVVTVYVFVVDMILQYFPGCAGCNMCTSRKMTFVCECDFVSVLYFVIVSFPYIGSIGVVLIFLFQLLY